MCVHASACVCMLPPDVHRAGIEEVKVLVLLQNSIRVLSLRVLCHHLGPTVDGGIVVGLVTFHRQSRDICKRGRGEEGKGEGRKKDVYIYS